MTLIICVQTYKKFGLVAKIGVWTFVCLIYIQNVKVDILVSFMVLLKLPIMSACSLPPSYIFRYPASTFICISKKTFIYDVFQKIIIIYSFLISHIKFTNIQTNMIIMICSNQPATFDTVFICMWIIWRFKCFFVHIHP